MTRYYYRRHNPIAQLLGGLLLLMIPVMLVHGAISELGWWSIGLAALLVTPWGLTIHWHRSRHLPGHSGSAQCPICARYHKARYAELRAAEAERAIQAHYTYLVAQDERRRG